MSIIKKNIIFDLNGVLFKKDLHRPGTMVPLAEGVALLHECHVYHDLYVCSNMKADYLEHLQKDYPDIMNVFKAIVTPQIASAEKPSKEIFMYLLEQYQLLPEESLLLDDHEMNIVAVESLGLKGIHVVDFDEVRQQLKQLSILSGD